MCCGNGDFGVDITEVTEQMPFVLPPRAYLLYSDLSITRGWPRATASEYCTTVRTQCSVAFRTLYHLH